MYFVNNINLKINSWKSWNTDCQIDVHADEAKCPGAQWLAKMYFCVSFVLYRLCVSNVASCHQTQMRTQCDSLPANLCSRLAQAVWFQWDNRQLRMRSCPSLNTSVQPVRIVSATFLVATRFPSQSLDSVGCASSLLKCCVTNSPFSTFKNSLEKKFRTLKKFVKIITGSYNSSCNL